MDTFFTEVKNNLKENECKEVKPSGSSSVWASFMQTVDRDEKKGSAVKRITCASIQVQITPSQGEISVGESKFFLCEAKYTVVQPGPTSAPETAPPEPADKEGRSGQSESLNAETLFDQKVFLREKVSRK
ncbi:Neural cell adhesion molecule 1 [Merluccius polli]|uniref:Neural cell adhesion molecule 1 n=1 Tax=Merluccius polli TaxID=89951 RepID=A0AA47MQG9_MERPO|nr:Neural cell adhesion molecule 1 [Merluccius polli]